MSVQWVTAASGIRYREHETRKHGLRPDRYFTIRFYVDGRRVEEALGWASEGWTLKLAQEELGKLRMAKRTGDGFVTLRERRVAGRKAAAEKAEDDIRREKAEKTVADLWERYRRQVVTVENKPRTIAEKTRIWERRIRPAIGALKLKDVTEDDVSTVVLSPFRLDESGQVIGGKAEAGNVYRLLNHMFNKALAWQLRARNLGNPLENVTEPKVAGRKRLLTGGEVGALLKALDIAEAECSEHPQVVAVVRAAFLTGARISELLGLRWEDVRRDEMELHLQDTKTGFSRRPMSKETMRLLDAVGRVPGSIFVFRSIENQRESLSYSTVEKAFRRLASKAGVEKCTLHTIRHWFATMTANSVSNPRVGMALTGHKSHVAYLNYIHGDRDQARALVDQLGALAVGLGRSEQNVTVLPSEELAGKTG